MTWPVKPSSSELQPDVVVWRRPLVSAGHRAPGLASSPCSSSVGLARSADHSHEPPRQTGDAPEDDDDPGPRSHEEEGREHQDHPEERPEHYLDAKQFAV